MGREEVKLSLYADDTVLYTENPKDSTQKLLEMMNKFSKEAGYKINIKKSFAFLCTNNEILEKGYKNTLPFKIALLGSSHHGSVVTKPTRIREGMGSIPGLAQWVKDPALP